MNSLVKNLLGIALIAGVLAVGYASYAFVDEYSKSIAPTTFRSFWVSAEGKAITVPDIAQFSFSVITEGGTDIAELQTENSKKMNTALDYLKDNDIDEKDVSTQSYNLNPRYSRTRCDYEDEKPCPPPEIVGYSIRQNVAVKIRDFDKISSVMTGIVDAGANSVSNLNFTIDDPTEIQNQAREEAILKAQEKAEGIAKAADFKVGRLLEISEDLYGAPVSRMAITDTAMTFGAVEKAELAPSIEPGSQEVRVNMRLKYEID